MSMATTREHATGNAQKGNQQDERADTYNATWQGAAAAGAHTRMRKRKQQAPKAKFWRQPSSIHIFVWMLFVMGPWEDE